MNTFTFKIQKGGAGSPFLITFEGKTFDDALEKVHALYPPKHNSVVIVDSRTGSLVDYIGPDSMTRIEHGKSRIRDTQSVSKRRKLGEK